MTVATAIRTFVVLQTADGMTYQQPIESMTELVAVLTQASANPPDRWWMSGYLPRT
jgi:hypothetical protein